jgi:hypothetical protein
MCVCVYIYIYIHTYIHTYIYKQAFTRETYQHTHTHTHGSISRPVDHGKQAFIRENSMRQGLGGTTTTTTEGGADTTAAATNIHASSTGDEATRLAFNSKIATKTVKSDENKASGGASKAAKAGNKWTKVRQDMVLSALVKLSNNARRVKLDAKNPNIRIVSVDSRLSKHSVSIAHAKGTLRGTNEYTFLVREALCDFGLLDWWPPYRAFGALLVAFTAFLFKVQVRLLYSMIIVWCNLCVCVCFWRVAGRVYRVFV